MTITTNIPARLALLCEPRSRVLSVGPDAIEALLSTWLSTPIALGHSEDGAPYLIGVEGKHLALSHGPGITAIALADAAIGFSAVPVAKTPAEFKAARKLLAPSDWAKIESKSPTEQAEVIAILVCLMESLLKRGFANPTGPHTLPEGSKPNPLLTPVRKGPIEWRPWLPLTASARIPAGLRLGNPAAALVSAASGTESAMVIETPNGPLAVAVAWTAAA